jgi:dolichyl-phosphate beta-glucosyltransferase
MIKSLSIIFPLYNEINRIEMSLIKIEEFLINNNFNNIEIILVNDGSTDATQKIIYKFIKNSKFKDLFKILIFKKNRGKGFALKSGIKIASNDWILTTDIDHSVPLKQVNEWNNKYIKKNKIVYFGSRAHPKSQVKKNLMRNLLGYFFVKLTYLIFNINISDTQCGFKLYEKKVAKKLFSNLQELGYIHDVEIAHNCFINNIQITELPVKWQHKKFGKINILIDPLIMFINLLILRIKL